MSSKQTDERRIYQTRQIMSVMQDWGLLADEIIDLIGTAGCFCAASGAIPSRRAISAQPGN